MPVTDKMPEMRASKLVATSPIPARADDGTRGLLLAGFWIMLVSGLALIATLTILGGIGIYGPHNNVGWLAFMFAMMGIPFALMLLVLGVAKWLRNRRLDRQAGRT